MYLLQAIEDFCSYLRIERSLSANTVSAYKSDLMQLASFAAGSDSNADSLLQELPLEGFLQKHLPEIKKKRKLKKLLMLTESRHYLQKI